jgi:hypothetical protein
MRICTAFLAAMRLWALAVLACLSLTPARADVIVYVGYAENERTPIFFPNPWIGSPNTTYLGYGGPDFDTGAILFQNTGPGDVTISPGVYADGFTDGSKFQLWDTLIGHGVTLHPGQNLILAGTESRNFDSSDHPIQTTPDSSKPVIHVTINGVARTYVDSGQVLNTGGLDVGNGLLRNESLQWRPIGTTGILYPGGTGVGRVAIPTHRADNARTGANLRETTLLPSNVNTDLFGKLFSYPVDGQIYAQPLLVSNVAITGKGTHNIVLVATEHDSVYAFDADSGDGANAGPLWMTSLIPSGGTSAPSGDICSGNISPEFGVTGTPVLDTQTGTLYVVANTKENGKFVHRLHALDVRSGAIKNSVLVQASWPGIGDGSVNGIVPFLDLYQANRAALLLANGIVYIAWTSHCDIIPYHGWITGYDAATLQLKYLWNDTPNAVTPVPGNYPVGGGGIWQTGSGPATDASGNLFFETGNGKFDVDTGGADYGDSFVKLGPDLSVLDYFTPFNQKDLDDADFDLGSSGPVVLPDQPGLHPHLLAGTSKEGKIYLVDRDTGKMGKFHAGDNSQIVQSIPNAIGGAWSSPAYFNGSVYFQGVGDVLKAYQLTDGLLSTTPVQQSGTAFGYPGATPAISADNTASDVNATGVVWTLENNNGRAVLHAQAAGDIATELYNSQLFPDRDNAGGYLNFTLPAVANGKVYVGTADRLTVYGSGFWAAAPVFTPNGGVFSTPVSVSIKDDSPGAAIYYTTDGSDPTTASTLYTGPFTVSTIVLVKARAYAYGFRPSVVASAQFLVGVSVGNGDGLAATYYDHVDLTGNTFTRVDPVINFNWNGGTPAPGIPGINWSARWTGFLQGLSSGEFTFTTLSDDGVRLWINNQLVIDDFTYHAPTEDSGKITLTAGVQYPIKLEYFQGGGGSMLTLSWATTGLPKQIVPQSQLYSSSTPRVAIPQISPDGGAFSPSVTVTITDATPGATIRYTTDGSDPTASSPVYKGAFTLTDSATVKAKGYRNGYAASLIASATFTLDASVLVYAINSGGGAAPPFVADIHYDTGNTFITGSVVDVSQVTDPAPLAVYQSERWGNAFNYTLPNLKPNAPYKVRLHFAEIYWTNQGQRVFNVAINGTQVLGNFDIVAEAGSSLKAIIREFTTHADANGNIVIAYTTIVDNAKSSGIEVLALPAAVSGKITLPGCVNSVQPITFTFRPTNGGAPFTKTVTLAADGAYSLSNIPAGTYILAIKGSKWLQRDVNVDTTGGDVSGVNATLLPGDVNNDNKVGILDLGLLADSFGKSQGQAGFNPNADLNCDGKVSLVDLGLLADNFGKQGDP